jgi:hypothetical protein
MPRQTALILALATLSATAVASFAQNAYPAAPNNAQNGNQNYAQTMQAQPAPIERDNVNPSGDNSYTSPLATGQTLASRRGVINAQPAQGIFLRIGHRSAVQAISVNPENTELRVTHGVANISIHNAAPHAEILVDLPGGQTDLIKNGFYTFNANTNTVRVLKGEAYTYPGANKAQKPIKVKEDHAVIFNGSQNGNQIKPFQFDPFQARADLIPYDRGGAMGEPGQPAYYGYGYAPYGLAYAGDPYLYDYGFGPWGYSPFGIGFYGGGFYGGGFRGGWGGHGGGWGGHGGGWGGHGGGGHGGGHGGR